MLVEYSKPKTLVSPEIIDLDVWMWNARVLYHIAVEKFKTNPSAREKVLLAALGCEGRVIPDQHIRSLTGQKYSNEAKRSASGLLLELQNENNIDGLYLYKIFDRGVSVLPKLKKEGEYRIESFVSQKRPEFLCPNWDQAYDMSHTLMRLNNENTLVPLFTGQQQSFLELFASRNENKVSYFDLLKVIYQEHTKSRLKLMKKDIKILYKSRNRVKSIISKMRKRSGEEGINCEVGYVDADDSYVLYDFSIK